jgi:dipeptidyl aminopeptidase/acylaminoacyl peptidase
MVRLAASVAAVVLTFTSPAFGDATPPAPASAPTKLGVDAFAHLPFVETAEISPDGKKMAGLLGSGGQQLLAVISLFNKDEKPVRLLIPDQTQARWVRWVNDENVLLGLTALRPVEGDRWYLSRVLSINARTGAITKLLWDAGGQNAGDVLWTAHDGSDEILLAAQDTIYSNYEGFWPTVYRVSASTGKKKVAVKGHTDVFDWAADGTGTVRAGFGYVDSSRSSRLLYRQPGDSSFKVVDRANLRREETLTAPFLFLPGGNQALIMRDNDKGHTSVYQVDLQTLATVKTIYEPLVGDVECAVLSDDRQMLLGLRLSTQSSVHWIDPELSALQAQFSKAVPDADVVIESMSRDRNQMLVRITAANMPGSLYYYDKDVGKLQRIAHINDKIGSKRLAPAKMIQYKARDGLEIEAVLTLPAGKSAKNLPFIMMPHGGPWGQDTLRYDYWAQFLANLGYAVLQPNFRGSTGYGTNFIEKGKGQLGIAMQDDLTDGFKWAVSQGFADPKRTCIVGASYGGYAAMWGVAKDPDQYRCAISIAGVSSLRREVNDFGNYLKAGLFRDQWKAMTPDFAAVSPINAIGRIKVPLLLIHGKKDVTVDHSQSAKMFAAMQNAKKPVEFVSLPLADHYYTRQDDRVALLTAMERFLAKHNPAD